MSFSIISQIFLILGGCPKSPFFDNFAQKARTLKNTIKYGVSAIFEKKKHMRHETAIIGPQNQNPEIPVIIFACFLLFQQKNAKTCWNPYFIVF